MTDQVDVRDVGSPDPEMNTSPIAAEGDEDAETLRQQVPGEPVCYFNNEAFRHGAYVRSGTAVLRCDYGIWTQVGSSDPDNP